VRILLAGVLAVVLLAGGAAAAGTVATDAAGDTADRSPAVVAPTATADVGEAGWAPAATQDGEEPLVESCAAEMPEDYADPAGGTTDTIGFVDGVWYDEPLDVTTEDGLTDDELRQVAARTAARVEAMRCLAFADGLPPIEVLDHEEFGNRTGDRYSNVSSSTSRLADAQLETMLMVPDDEGFLDVAEETASNSTLGQYFIEEDRIVLVRPEGSTAPIRESTLFQELGHALQDQQFNLSRAGEMTSDESDGWTGLVEGDINWVEFRYVDRCEAGRWVEPCISPDSEAGDGESSSSEPPSWGYSLARQQPYYEGPAFVRQVYREGGWDAVNALYEAVPASALAVIAPERADGATLVEPEVTVEPAGDWERLSPENGSATDELGVGWIASMFMAPSWESGFERNVVDPQAILHFDEDGNVSEVGGITFDPAAAMGWRGDRMAVYERGNETATLWRTAWADGAEAEEFAGAYEQLLSIRNASTAEGYDAVYAFDDSSGYTGAVSVVQDGDRVRIVSAPSVDALTQVAPDLAIGESAADGEESGSGSEGDGDSGDGDGSDDGLPGFGVAVALLGALGGALLAARRGR
jgi:PGF-CTERM protein